MLTSSSSDSDEPAYAKRLFGHQRPLHEILGGGKAADILLWKDKNLSAAILIGFTIIWFLFELVEYNFITFLCQISIMVMQTLFIWSAGVGFVDWSPPDFGTIRIPESTFKWLLAKIYWLLQELYTISLGKDLRTFVLAITFLWILATIGNYFCSLNLLYIGFLYLATLPAVYERYQYEVDHLVSQGKRNMKKLYKKFDSKFLNKIPRGPVKETKNF